MGFGLLFIGYFLQLNITYYSFTDLISALVMALGLQKLSKINSPFKTAYFSSFAYAVIGLYELVAEMIGIFSPRTDVAKLISYSAIPRYAVIGFLTAFILLGIKEVASEVSLKELSAKAKISLPTTIVIYLFPMLLELPFLKNFQNVKLFAIFSVIALFLLLILIITNLTSIYTAYMKICMPSDVDNDVSDKPSRFEFVNKYREHTAKKQKEYTDYKLDKIAKKASRKKKK